MKYPAFLAVLVCLCATRSQAQFPVFPTADSVLGRPDFTTGSVAGVTQASMADPSGIAVDPVSGKVFVSISGQNRILRFASSAAVTNGTNAEAVIGQTSYTTSSPGTSATTLRSPFGIAIDFQGRLWVADTGNHRVLMYEGAANLPQFGAAADLVLGQSNFTTSSALATRINMSGPSDVDVDAVGNLWVADRYNDRVLRFADAATLGDGAPATSVLGQADFVTGTNGTSDVKMSAPVAVLLDPAGRLWVAEQTNHRVTRFDLAATLADGSPADAVLGQTDFVSGSSGTSPAKLGQPNSLAIDRNGTLYICDYSNNRVVYHRSPATKADGAAPDGVIGQPDLTTTTGGTTAQKLSGPYGGLDFDAAGNLWVTDFTNNRAVRFPGDFAAASPSVKGNVPKTTTRGKLTIKGTATDPNGVASVRYRVGKRPFKAALGTTAWTLKAKLKPGKNTIEIVAEDSFGNVSPAKIVKVKRQ